MRQRSTAEARHRFNLLLKNGMGTVCLVILELEPHMNSTITLGVYRRLDNRLEGLPDDSPRALELHNRRRDALHAAFDHEPLIRVTNWGQTDDKCSHEFVELVLGAAATGVLQYSIVPGIKWLGQKLAEKAVDTTISELAKAVIAKLRPPQQAKQVQDFIVTLPDKTQISVYPPDQSATITIRFADGAVQEIQYTKAADQAAGE
jgi:hypothetical protein